jgi:serine phosphatase RsbU (regulator of sigma subunit)
MCNLKSKKVLVVEDDIVFSLAVCGQLVSVGFDEENIYRTDRVEEFSEIAVSFVPEIILLDLNITDSNGISTFEKSNEAFPLATTIVLSGMDDEMVALEIVKKGAQDYILKTELNAQLLYKSIQYGMERKRLVAELFSKNKVLEALNSETLNINAHLEELVKERTSEIERQSEIISEKNKEIIDSINYARRIQFALLTPEDVLKEKIPNMFILYKPKDIVGGDFYWHESLVHPDGSSWDYFCVADCTGHGIPGAFMSLIGIKILNQAVKLGIIFDPAGYLGCLNIQIYEALNKYSPADDLVADGMDAVMFAVNRNTRQMLFAGANNPLYLVRNGELQRIKGDKKAIGAHARSAEFTNHLIQLQEGDMIYGITDGFAHQFGGDEGKKMKLHRMQELLLDAAQLNLTDQKSFLDNSFKAWQRLYEQVDDICVMGLRVE